MRISDWSSDVCSSDLQGKELSYNNLTDTDAAYELVAEFDEPALAIIKHAHPCGLPVATDLSEAWDAALACDPVSAFGALVAHNRPRDAAPTEPIPPIFSDVIIPPALEHAPPQVLAPN